MEGYHAANRMVIACAGDRCCDDGAAFRDRDGMDRRSDRMVLKLGDLVYGIPDREMAENDGAERIECGEERNGK